MKLKKFWVSNKKLLLAIFAGLGAVTVIILAWWWVVYLKEPVVPAQQAIPENISWFIRFKNVKDLWKRFYYESEIGRELRNIAPVNEYLEQLKILDSISDSDVNALRLIDKSDVFFNCRYKPDGTPEYLILLNLPSVHEMKKVQKLFLQHAGTSFSVIHKKFNTVDYLQFVRNGIDEFFIGVYKGIFIYSRSEGFLQDAIAQLLKTQAGQERQGFYELTAMSGKYADGNLFINLNCLKYLLQPVVSSGYVDELEFLSAAGSQAGLDVNLKSDEITLSGYVKTTEKNYLHLLQDNPAQKMELTRMIPYNTAIMVYFGIENLQLFAHKLEEFSERIRNPGKGKTLKKTKTFIRLETKESIFSFLGNEMALVITEPESSDYHENIYGVFKIKNKEKARENLILISEQISPNIQKENKNNSADSLEIRKISESGNFTTLFGNIFSPIKNPYCLILEQYLILANTPEALKRFVAGYFSSKTLDRNENYMAFADNVSDNSTFCLYVNVRKSVNIIPSFLSGKIQEQFHRYKSKIRNFQAFAIQVLPEKNMFFSNIYLKYNPSYLDENPAIWERALDTSLYGKPVMVRNEKNFGKIAVFDRRNQLYLIDDLGRIEWKVQLDGKPLSDIFVIERYRNNQKQLVFNTAKYIYMLDLTGKAVQGYPLPLKNYAAGGMLVVDYDQRKDYRFLFVGKNQIFYNLNAEGKPVVGWNNPRIPEPVCEKPAYLRLLDKDILIVSGENGQCYFFDRRGKSVFPKAGAAFRKQKNASFYIFRDGRNSAILTHDVNGKIIHILSTGEVRSITTGKFSPFHYFTYNDFNGDGIPDYIYLDTGSVVVYNVNRKLINHFSIGDSALIAPQKLTLKKGRFCYATLSEASGRIYLFDKSGLLPANRFLTGNSLFCSGALDISGNPSLIVAKDKVLYNYSLNGW